MPRILRLSKSYKEFSAGTLFQNLPAASKESQPGMMRVKALSSQLVSKRTGMTRKPELEIPISYLDEYKGHTFIVPAINGRERRRKIRKAMRALSTNKTPQESG